jgi:GAF domain-containing protein
MAFAQVGALRLNTGRGVISFIGRDTEYVIAEAGRTLSPQSDYRHTEGDQLWFGEGPLPTGSGLGLAVMNILTDRSHHTPQNVIVGDLRQDERFSQLPMVTGPPFARFLVSLPLRTPAGYPIGTTLAKIFSLSHY